MIREGEDSRWNIFSLVIVVYGGGVVVLGRIADSYRQSRGLAVQSSNARTYEISASSNKLSIVLSRGFLIPSCVGRSARRVWQEGGEEERGMRRELKDDGRAAEAVALKHR